MDVSPRHIHRPVLAIYRHDLHLLLGNRADCHAHSFEKRFPVGVVSCDGKVIGLTAVSSGTESVGVILATLR